MLPLRAPVSAAFGLVLAAERARRRLAGGARRLAAARRRAGRAPALARRRDRDRRARSSRSTSCRAAAPSCSTSPRASCSTIAGDRLPARYRRGLARYRYGPGVFKLDWALDGPIPWTAPEAARAGTVHLGGTLDEIAAAEQAVSDGEHPERPFVLLVQPSLFDPTPRAGRASTRPGPTATCRTARRAT